MTDERRQMVRGGDVHAASRDLSEVRYCTRCDLGFCGRHEGSHRRSCDRALVEWPGHISSPLCAVCSGIYSA